MLEIDIKYPVENGWPPDEQSSILDLRKQGFREDDGAVVMRSSDGQNLFILLNDPVDGRHWMPLRID